MAKITNKPYKTIQDLQELSKSFSTPELLCNHVLECVTKKDKIMKKLVAKYIDRYPEFSESKTLYFDTFKDYIKTVRMINDYYDTKIFTEFKINQALILEHGRNYPDGFSGLRIKKMSYSSDYIIEIVDGECGQQFIKTYNKLPTKEQMIYDSVFPDILFNDSSNRT